MGSLGSEEVLSATGQGVFLKLEPPKYNYAISEDIIFLWANDHIL